MRKQMTDEQRIVESQLRRSLMTREQKRHRRAILRLELGKFSLSNTPMKLVTPTIH